jgi:Cu/Zn superoxide dismutase
MARMSGIWPNIVVPDAGSATVEHLHAFVSLTGFRQHAARCGWNVHRDPCRRDDYKTDPSGESGGRIAAEW